MLFLEQGALLECRGFVKRGHRLGGQKPTVAINQPHSPQQATAVTSPDGSRPMVFSSNRFLLEKGGVSVVHSAGKGKSVS